MCGFFRYLAKTFSYALNHVQPDIIVFLGDLTDEGSNANDADYELYVKRFNNIFSTSGREVKVGKGLKISCNISQLYQRKKCPTRYFAYHPVIHIIQLWRAVAQLVECRTRNRESPGSNPRCYRFEVWAFSFTSRRLSRLSCINEYLAIDSGGNVSE